MLVLIICMMILTFLYLYTVIRSNKESDLELLQRAYLISLLEALCTERGIDIGDLKESVIKSSIEN